MTPAIGAIFASFIAGIALLIIGIYMIAAGLSGKTESVIPPTANFR
jgi:putative Mn2+ efflux pump MntP